MNLKLSEYCDQYCCYCDKNKQFEKKQIRQSLMIKTFTQRILMI